MCALLAVCAVGVVPARALAAPASNGGSRILGMPSGRCLDVIGGATAPGTRVQLYDCLGDPQQAWTYAGGQLQVYTGSDTLCLDASSNQGGVNGSPDPGLDLPRHGQPAVGRRAQRVVALGGLRPLPRRRRWWNHANGTRLQLWDCLGDAQQDWVGPPQPNGGGPVKGLGSGRCLDVTNAGISPGTRPQLWNCLGDAQQQWLLEGQRAARLRRQVPGCDR